MGRRPDDEFSDPGADDDAVGVSRAGGAGTTWRGSARWGADVADRDLDDLDDLLDDSDDPVLDPDDATDRPAPSPRRRRRPLLLGAAGILVLAVVTGAVLLAQERDRRTPEAAVLEYVGLIEAGDVEAATRMVPVLGDPADAQPEPDVLADGASRPPVVVLERTANGALLTDAFYAANAGLSDVTVERADDAPLPDVGGSVEVTVGYRVQDTATTAVLRVERAPDSAVGLPVWHVRDSLAVPLVVTLPDGGLGSAYVDGARVAVTGERSVPLYASMLYPGVYTISFDGGTFLQAGDVERRVAAPSTIVDPAVAHTAASLAVVPSPAAFEAIRAEIDAFMERCAASTENRVVCPLAYRQGRAPAEDTTVAISESPLQLNVYAYRTVDTAVQMISGTVQGTLTYPGTDGPVTEPFSLAVDFAIDDVEPRAQVRSLDLG